MTKQEYLLMCLQEECAELIKEINKALRFGLDERNITDLNAPTNLERVNKEWNEVQALSYMLSEECSRVLLWDDIPHRIEKVKRVEEFMEYSQKLGIVDSKEQE